MTRSDISVVIGTYNGAKHIEQQLSTVLDQTLQAAEVLVCDDGSVDGTLEIVERLASTSAVPVRIVRNTTRLGFADNFLHGAELAVGGFVAFCDQDDIWYREKLETVARALRDEGALLAAHAVDLIDSAGAPLGVDVQGIERTRGVAPLTEGPWRNFFGFSLVVDKRLLSAVPRSSRGRDTHSPETPLSHDRWTCFLGLSLARAVFIARPLAAYRQHEGQLYGSDQGPPQHTSILGRQRRRYLHYRTSVGAVASRSATRAEQCRDRARLLRGSTWPDRAAVGRAARHWDRLAAHYERRQSIYRGRILTRAGRLLRMIRLGAYASTHRSGLGRRALVQDVWSLTVPPAPLISPRP